MDDKEVFLFMKANNVNMARFDSRNDDGEITHSKIYVLGVHECSDVSKALDTVEATWDGHTEIHNLD